MSNSIAIHNLLTAINYQGSVVATVGLSDIKLSDGSKINITEHGVKVTHLGGGVSYCNSRKVFALIMFILSDKNHQKDNIKELLLGTIHSAVLPIYDTFSADELKFAMGKCGTTLYVRIGEADFTSIKIDLTNGEIFYREEKSCDYTAHKFEYLESLPAYNSCISDLKDILTQVGELKLFVA